jgi:hypothetical protein
MLNESRIDIYNYLYNLFYGTVTENVYSMNEPQELTDDDTNDGFIVIRVGDIHDDSEFSAKAYGWARCYVEAFIPPISRGRLDVERYKAFEDAINEVVKEEMANNDGTYYIQDGSVISTDTEETTNANNVYFTFIKSFIVNIDEKE